MRDETGFDLWADDYDKSVQLMEERNSYPFAGYKEVLGRIYSRIRQGQGRRVLELGFGTGTLAKKLYDQGYSICGLDFSQRMIRIAAEKMPEARLIHHDFSLGLPEALRGETFDAIVSTYALHHLPDERKISFLPELVDALRPGGVLLIGDVAFPTAAERAACRERSPDWDHLEHYATADTLCAAVPGLDFAPVSFCAGIFSLEKHS